MKKSNVFIGAVTAFCMTVFIILFSVFTVVNDRDFYPEQFEKNNVARDCKMSLEDVNKAMTVLLDYLEGKRDDISVTVEKDGVTEEAFYERETLHMVDVKALYRRAKAAMYFSLAAACGGLLRLMCKTKRSKKEFSAALKSGMKITGIIFAVFIAVIIAAVLYDFNRFWIKFHELFFSNDLWLLDPRYSTMINMLPEPLFEAMVVKIIVRFVLIMSAFLGSVFFLM